MTFLNSLIGRAMMLATATISMAAMSYAQAQPEPVNPKVARYSANPNAGKISEKLLSLGQRSKGRVAALPQTPELSALSRTADGLLVEVVCDRLNDAVLKKFALPGVTVRDYFPEYKRVVLEVADLKELEAIANIPEVGMVTPVYKPITNAMGAADSRADRAHFVQPLIANSINGAGQKVGILSDSFALTDGVRDLDTLPGPGLAGTLTGSKPQDTGDLPPTVQIIRDDAVDGAYADLTGADEGAAMGELIYDIAPGAALAFHTAAGGEAQFATGIKKLREAGSTVIVDDIIYFKEPMYQTGIVAAAAADAVKKGVAYFSAAGNFGDLGLVRNYVDLNPAVDDTILPTAATEEKPYEGNDLHDWGGGNAFLPIFLPADVSQVQIFLQWNQPFYSVSPSRRAGSQIDLDLYVTGSPTVDGVLSPIASSTEIQGFSRRVPSGDAFEMVTVGGGGRTVFLAVDHFNGSQTNIPQVRNVPLEFRIVIRAVGCTAPQVQGITFPGGGPTMWGHALADGVVSVAAVPWWESPAFNPGFGATDQIDPELFTSRGGVFKHIFNVRGRFDRRAQNILAPVISAVDANNTTFFGAPDVPTTGGCATSGLPADVLALNYDGEPDGFPNFFGTSAAAPNAAAVAALLRQNSPADKPAQITQKLINSAIDVKGQRAAPGYDDVSGHGLIDAAAAAAGNQPLPNLAFLTPPGWETSVVVNQTQNNFTNTNEFTSAQNTYVHLAITNNGGIATSSPFTVQVLVDNVVIHTINLPGLGVNVPSIHPNLSLGQLLNGPHTIRVVIDPANTVGESNEGDNIFERNINVAAPNLAFFQPVGWTDSMVVNQTIGSRGDATNFSVTQNTYVSFAVTNSGGVTIPQNTTAQVIVDNVVVHSIVIPGLAPGQTHEVTDLNIGTLAAGPHTVSVLLDATNAVSESNEADNLRTKNVVGTAEPNLGFIQLPGWSDSVVINQTLGQTTEPPRYNNIEPLYVHWAITNNGAQDVAAPFTVETYLFDGVSTITVDTVVVPGLTSGANFQRKNIALGALTGGDSPIGDYIITVVIDTTSAVAESNEFDNIRIKPFHVGAAPANDNIASALAVDSCLTSITANNFFATKENCEPFHAGNRGGSSVWFQFTTPASSEPIRFTIDTLGSDFNTLLGIYTATGPNFCNPGEVVFVASNDDIVPGSILQSQVTLEAAGSTTFFIAVDGFNGEQGNIQINFGIGITNDNFADATPLLTESGTLDTLNFCATEETGEPDHAGNPGGKSIWFRWIAPQTGTGLFTTAGSRINTLLAVYTGTALDSLNEVASNDDLAPGEDEDSYVTFNITQGVEYFIAVDGFNGEAGNITLSWSSGLNNDFFGSPTELQSERSGDCGVSSSNVGASAEPGEPVFIGNQGGSSVWFRWTAPPKDDPVSGDPMTSYPVTFDTIGSDFDTILGIYQGTSINTVDLLAFNDNVAGAPPSMTQSRVSFNAFVGQQYYILVDGKNIGGTPQEGQIVLNWDDSFAPTNDFIGNVIFFPNLNATLCDETTSVLYLGTNKGASRQVCSDGNLEPNHAGQPGKRSVWYSLTLADHDNCASFITRRITVAVTARPESPDYDPVVAVYQTSPGGECNLVSVAFQDDITPGSNTDVNFSFIGTPGTYLIAVDGKFCTSGNFDLFIENAPAPIGAPGADDKSPEAEN